MSEEAERYEPLESLVEMETLAEEPIEDRLRRAWLNGFREGVERSGRGIRWDHS